MELRQHGAAIVCLDSVPGVTVIAAGLLLATKHSGILLAPMCAIKSYEILILMSSACDSIACDLK